MYKAVEDSELQKIPVVQKRVDLSNQDFIHSLDFFKLFLKSLCRGFSSIFRSDALMCLQPE